MDLPERTRDVVEYYTQLGERRAQLGAENPLTDLVSGKAVVFCLDATGFPGPEAVGAYRRGVERVFPGCRFIVVTGPAS